MKIAPAILIGLCSLTCAGQVPDAVIPEGVGVNIHFTRGHEQDLDMIAAAGFKFVRMDFGWSGTERKKGEYDWTAYDELTANLEKRGIRALYILDYSNPLYEETVVSKNPITGAEQKSTASPQHPESVAAFAKWAAAAAQHLKNRRIIWEIWNEPNISFWKPKPDVQQYTLLALATCKAIRQVDPGAVIVGPATSEVPMAFLEAFFKSGVLEYLDAVTVHPYRNYRKPPESAAEDYEKLRALIERFAPSPEKKSLPILSGEWGYATHTKGISLETQAAFIARQQLANLLAGVPLSIWYDWKNDGTDPGEREHNFGTVTHDLKPKPAYRAIQTLTRELSGFRIDRRIRTERPEDYLLICRNTAGDQRLVAWTLGEPHALSVTLDRTLAAPIGAVAGDGAPVRLESRQEQLSLRLGPAPLYVRLGSVSVRE
jgi:hypothetical protein